jgi:hypothetical protein
MVPGPGNRYAARRAYCGSDWAVAAGSWPRGGYTTRRASLSAQLILHEHRSDRR